MTAKVKRIPIVKYIRSGKLVAVTRHLNIQGNIVIDMLPDLRGIRDIRQVKFLKKGAVIHTEYTLEALERIGNSVDDKRSIDYTFRRILTDDDLCEEKWKNTERLENLPVSPHEEITREEEIWAGHREGNIKVGLTLLFGTLVSWGLFYLAVKHETGTMVAGIIAAGMTLFLVKFEWKASQKAAQEKLEKLVAHKIQLRIHKAAERQRAQTEVEKLLEDYSNWETLSPREFEHALTFKLKKDGFDLKATQFVGDGGIDLEGVDSKGEPVIVQAKKFRSNVGVAVVREMIGIRESSPDKPLTMIVSLVGFTKGAKVLADREGVILRSVKEEILGV